jgi:hypothetical protein
MDIELHAERVESRTRRKVTRTAVAGDLPDGVIISLGHTLGLWCDGSMLPWSLEGYGAPVGIDAASVVTLLTPPSIVAALQADYRPMVHPSAGVMSLRSFPA